MTTTVLSLHIDGEFLHFTPKNVYKFSSYAEFTLTVTTLALLRLSYSVYAIKSSISIFSIFWNMQSLT